MDVRWVLSMLVRPRATGISTSSSRLVSGSTGCTGREPGDDQTNVTSSRTVTLGGDQGVHTLALSVIERTREIGLLRAVAMGRPQLRRLVRLEPSVPVGRLLALLAIAGALGVLAAVWPALMPTWRARSRSMSKLVRTKFRPSGDCPRVEQVAVPPEAAAARPADAVRDDRVELYRDAGAGHCATIVGAVVGTRRSPAHRRRP